METQVVSRIRSTKIWREGIVCSTGTNSHNMADCKVIWEQVSKMRASWNLRSSNVAKHQK